MYKRIFAILLFPALIMAGWNIERMPTVFTNEVKYEAGQTLLNTLTVGSDGDGSDVKFYSETASCYWLWDESADQVDQTVTSATTTGTQRAHTIQLTQTGASASKILEAFRVNIDANVMTGDWVNAIVARVDYGNSGSAAGGMVAPLCAELSLPSGTPSGGAYYVADLEMEAPENHVEHGNVSFPTAWLNFAIYGNSTAIGSVEDYGFLMRLDGFTSGTGNILYNNTIRNRIGSTTWYLPMSSAEGEYETAYLIDVTNTTDASSLTAGSIQTDGGLAVAKQIFVGDDIDMSVSGTGTYDITLKDGVADALSIVRGTTDMVVFNTTTPSITITPATTVTGQITANAGINMGTSQTLTGTTGLTIGAGTETVAINSSDWDIDATGVMSGIGNIGSNGSLALSASVSGGITITPIATGTGVATIQNQNVATSTITLPSATTTLPGLSLANVWTAAQTVNDDLNLAVGTTATNGETQVRIKFDEATSGIGQFRLGDFSNPQVLKVDPGATVAGSIVNINHTLGAGDCDDLLGSYSKVNVLGDGDSGITIVGDASRAYVGLTGGANNSVASQAYGTQAWARHGGTGAITAMSGLSAMMDVGAENFTATTINSGHFHIQGAGDVTGQFDGVMVEAYPDVDVMDALLALCADAGADVDAAIRISGTTECQVLTASGAKIFTGTAANGDAVYAEVGTYDAIGSIYLNATNGYIYIQVANAGAAADWYKVTASDAD
jgi:hypothetical protein